jgi:lipopolysaccharide transport system ATP-binding protein
MKKKEIDAKFDEIVAFAELEKFIDTPVKRYSSGMYVRLGFAVAAHLEPEILLVDEVLAVGDAAFQKKCLAKMGEVAKEGRTVLFVSHHMNVIQRLCNSCMLLSEGHLEQQGPSHSVIGTYLRRLTRGTQGAPSKPFLDGNSPIHLLKMFFSDIDGNPRTSFTKDQPFFLNIEYQIVEPIKDVHVSVWFLTMDSVVFMSSYDTDCFPIFATCREPGIYRCRVHIRPGFLNVGQYGIRLLAFVPNTPIKFFDDTSLFVEITDPAEEWSHRVGAIVPMFNWEVEYVHNPTTAQ